MKTQTKFDKARANAHSKSAIKRKAARSAMWREAQIKDAIAVDFTKKPKVKK